MGEKQFLTIVLLVALIATVATGCNSKQNVSGVWKGTIEASETGGKNNWQGPAELTLNQNGDTVSGTLSFTHPQGGRVQFPINSGIVSKDAVTFCDALRNGRTSFRDSRLTSA